MASPIVADHAMPARAIDALFADVDRAGSPGYAIGIEVDGHLVYAHGYGRSNLDDDVSITPRTAFHLASLSKQFTGAAIALLILDGKLSLEDPVGKYIPELVKYGSVLRIKHLVYMTSGIRDYTDRPRRAGLPWFSDFYFTRDEAIAAALRAPALDEPPGTRWRYANVNYMLLTRIVEIVSGQPFRVFMAQRVFGPLCMRDTLIDDDTTRVIAHRAIGYAPRSPEILEASRKVGFVLLPGPGYARMNRVSPHFGGSGVFSTLDDLARWNGEFEKPTLGGTAFVDLMQRRERFPNGKDDDAFGLVRAEYRGRTMWWYSGADLDGSTYMARFPDARVSVICLSNILGGDCTERSAKVIDLLLESGVMPAAAPSRSE